MCDKDTLPLVNSDTDCLIINCKISLDAMLVVIIKHKSTLTTLAVSGLRIICIVRRISQFCLSPFTDSLLLQNDTVAKYYQNGYNLFVGYARILSVPFISVVTHFIIRAFHIVMTAHFVLYHLGRSI